MHRKLHAKIFASDLMRSLRTALLSAVNSRVFSLTLFTDSSSRCRWARRRRAAACGVSLWLIHHVWLDSHASSLWSVTKVLLHFFVHPVSYITTAHTHTLLRVCVCVVVFLTLKWTSSLFSESVSYDRETCHSFNSCWCDWVWLLSEECPHVHWLLML